MRRNLRDFMNGQRSITVLLFTALAGVPLTLPASAQNVKWGPFRATLGASAGVTYTDNANLDENNHQSDIYFDAGPDLNADLSLGPYVRLPGGEELRLTMSGGYRFRYSTRNGTVESFGAPVSLSIVIPLYIRYIGWTVTVSDNFSHTRETIDTTFGFGRQQTSVFNNAAALTANRSFGKTTLTLAAQRNDQFVPDFPEQEVVNYRFSITPSYALRDGYSVYWSTTYDINDYQDPAGRDSTGYTSSVGLSGQLTRNLNGTVGVGYSHYDVEATGVQDKRSFDRPYFIANLNFGQGAGVRVRKTTATFSAFYNSGVSGASATSTLSEVYGVSGTVFHPVNRWVTIDTTVSYTRVNDLIGTGPGDADTANIMRVTAGLTHVFSRKLTGRLAYTFQQRFSDQEGGNYRVNTISGTLSYVF